MGRGERKRLNSSRRSQTKPRKNKSARRDSPGTFRHPIFERLERGLIASEMLKPLQLWNDGNCANDVVIDNVSCMIDYRESNVVCARRFIESKITALFKTRRSSGGIRIPNTSVGQ